MNEVHDRLLWVGSAFDLRSPRELFDNEILAVVDVSLEEAPAQLPRQLMYCRFPLNDGGGNDPRLLRISVQTVVAFLNAGITTILGCSAGMSRSPTIAAFALAAMVKPGLLEFRHHAAFSDERVKKLALPQNLWVASAIRCCFRQRILDDLADFLGADCDGDFQ